MEPIPPSATRYGVLAYRWGVRRAALLLCLGGCIAQMTSATRGVSPPASGGGTLTCRQIVEQCDAQCGDPLCVRRCGDQGTPEAASQHDAVVECAQRNGCTDEPCLRANCAAEADTCQGPEPVESRPDT
jgi:hypothetical protein